MLKQTGLLSRSICTPAFKHPDNRTLSIGQTCQDIRTTAFKHPDNRTLSFGLSYGDGKILNPHNTILEKKNTA